MGRYRGEIIGLHPGIRIQAYKEGPPAGEIQPGKGKVEAYLPRQAHTSSFYRHLKATGSRVHPCKAKGRQPGFASVKPFQGAAIILLVLSPCVFPVIYNNQDKDAGENLRRIRGKGLEGVEKIFVFSQRRDHHRAGETAAVPAREPPRAMNCPCLKVFRYERREHARDIIINCSGPANSLQRDGKSRSPGYMACESRRVRGRENNN
jgi:hypothetical protein